MCMKTLRNQTKCHQQKAKIGRKSEEFVGHLDIKEGVRCQVLGIRFKTSGIRCRVSGAKRQVLGGESQARREWRRATAHNWCIRCEVFRLLKCKNEWPSGYVDENVRGVTGYGKRDTGEWTAILPQTGDGSGRLFSLLTSISCLLILKNEGASGDVDENIRRVTGNGIRGSGRQSCLAQTIDGSGMLFSLLTSVS
jgi:hypothetical protein